MKHMTHQGMPLVPSRRNMTHTSSLVHPILKTKQTTFTLHSQAETLRSKETKVEQKENLIKVFPSIKGLIILLGEVDRKGLHLRPRLPGFTAAVAWQGIVMDHVIVRIFPSEDAAPAGTAQGCRCVLDSIKKQCLIQHFIQERGKHRYLNIFMRINMHLNKC